MSTFSFWHRLEKLFRRMERFCHEQRNKAFDRDLERDFKRCTRQQERNRK